VPSILPITNPTDPLTDMKKSILILSILYSFSGCMVGPKYQRPQSSLSADYYRKGPMITGKDSVSALKWFDLFKDPTLKSLLDSALARNYDLKIAIARIGQAEAAYGIAKAGLFPSFGYSAGATEQFGKSAGPDVFSFGTGMSWEIDIWGKIRHAKRAALDDLLASEETRKAVQSTLVASVSNAYFQLRDYDNRLAISRATFLSREEGYLLQSERFKKGYISEWDLLQAKQLMEDARASIATYERAVAITENFICTLTASPPAAVSRGLENSMQPLPPAIPSGLPSSLLEQRPDVKRAELVYMRETERIGIAEALRYPALSLTGTLGFASTDLTTLVSSDALAGSLTQGLLGPIFAFGANKRRVEAQRKSAEAAAYEYANRQLNALREVEDALVTVATTTRELQARTDQAEAARKVVVLSQARYDNGFTSYLELLDAQRTLFETEIIVSAVRQQQLNGYVELYRALGGGW
jgi:outer membrane protein, multidrug efflux system